MPEADNPGVTTSAEPGAVEVQARDAVATLADNDEVIIPTPVAGLALRFTKGQSTLTPENMRLLAPLRIEADYDPAQVMVWLLDARARGFNPWARETFLYKIGGQYVRHVGIEGLRKKAELTGQYRGQTAPEFAGPDGKWTDLWLHERAPLAARVGIYRAGFAAPVYRPIFWAEYCPMIEEERWVGHGRDRRKERTGQWVPAANWRPASRGGKPLVMLAKCAEAAAFRAAFPNEFQGYYVPEETQKMTLDAQREAAMDAATERRHAAYRKAQQQDGPAPAPAAGAGAGAGKVVDSTAVEHSRPQTPAEHRDLAMAELIMQATIFDRDMAWMTRRWSAARGGRTFDTASPAEVVEHALRFRSYAIEALRGQNRHAEADAYERAGDVITTVAELLGGRIEAEEEQG